MDDERPRLQRNLTARRTIAFGIDVVLPAVPAAVAATGAWLLVRPDRAEGMDGLGAALVVVAVGVLTALVLFVVNDLVVVGSRGATTGERWCGFRLEVPGTASGRSWRLAARTLLRLGVVTLVVAVVGLATQYVGESVLGVLVGAVVSAALLGTLAKLGAQGPTTVLERICGIRVSEV